MVVTTKFLFDMWNCTVESDFGMGNVFCSSWGFSTCVDTSTCDRMSLQAWNENVSLWYSIKVEAGIFYLDIFSNVLQSNG